MRNVHFRKLREREELNIKMCIFLFVSHPHTISNAETIANANPHLVYDTVLRAYITIFGKKINFFIVFSKSITS